MQRLSTTENEAELSFEAKELTMICNALRQVVETLDESELEFLVGASADKLTELADELHVTLSDMNLGPEDNYIDEDEVDEDEDEDEDEI